MFINLNLSSNTNYPDKSKVIFGTIVSAFLGLGLFWGMCQPGDIHTDGGIFSAIAYKCLHGGQLYVDAWENKPPAIFLLNELFLLIFPNKVYALFIMASLAMASLSILMFRLAYMNFRSLLISILLILAALPFAIYRNNTGDGLYTEIYGTLCLLASLFFYASNQEKYKLRNLTLSLIFAGLAPWFKEPFILVSVPLLILIIYQNHKKFSCYKSLLIFLAPAILLLAYLWLTGSLEAFIQTTIYNLKLKGNEENMSLNSKLQDLWSRMLSAVFIILLIQFYLLWRHLKRPETGLTAVLIFSIQIASLVFGLIFPGIFGHYYFPFFNLFFACFCLFCGISNDGFKEIKWPLLISLLFMLDSVNDKVKPVFRFEAGTYVEDAFVKRLRSETNASLFVDYIEKSGYYIKAEKVHPAFMPVGVSAHFEIPEAREIHLKKIWSDLSKNRPDYLITTYTTSKFSWSLPDTKFYENNYHKVDSLLIENSYPLYLWKRNP